eukprot:Rhum_TRINITY_DN6255_c1_g1::Rhum_TRINITY_DN6255_c1_g1_i1::g.19499::m.19499
MRFVLSVAMCCAVVQVSAKGELDEFNRNDLWVKALTKCGDKGRDEDVTAAVECQTQMEARFSSIEGKNGYEACDREYCECTGGVWTTTLTPHVCVPNVKCTQSDCECMEQCYAKQMQCAFDHTVHLYSTATKPPNPCDKALITKCVQDTFPDLVSECKRGLQEPKPFISWMSQPVPTGCNAVLVCAGSTAMVSSVLVTLIILLHLL